MVKLKKRTKESIAAAIGAFIVILVLAFLTENMHYSLMIASFGSTCAIVFSMPKSPAARARNILFTYTVASVTAYLLYHFFGYNIYTLALGVAFTTFIMLWETLIHPPASGIPIFFYYIKPGPEFLLFPILAGCVIIILARKIYVELCKPEKLKR